jgi:hypothetical protein
VEAWFSLQDFPGYSVSSQGRVRNDRFERVLTVLTNGRGVAMVSVTRDGKKTKVALGRLVAKAFVEVPIYRIPFDTVIHLDGNNMNNHPSNLRWRPFWFAKVYCRQFKIYSGSSLPIRDCNTGEIYGGVWEVVTRNGVLYRDVITHAYDHEPVFPTFQRFEWI